MIQDYLKQLSQDLKIEGGLPLTDGACSFLLDETSITISEAESGYQFMATLGDVPHDQAELFYAKMLRGDLFFQATNGSTLGLDEEGTKLILRFYCPTKTSYRDFKERLEDFMNTCDFWKEEIKNHETNPLAA
jgi:hypothetical protein